MHHGSHGAPGLEGLCLWTLCPRKEGTLLPGPHATFVKSPQSCPEPLARAGPTLTATILGCVLCAQVHAKGQP